MGFTARAPSSPSTPGSSRTRASAAVLALFLLAACDVVNRRPLSTPPKASGEPLRSLPGPPSTRREDVADLLHGTSVADPYRWLEDGDDPAVKAWADAQDSRCRAALDALGSRPALAKRLKELFYVDAFSTPQRCGARTFYSRKQADREKAIVYVREGEEGEERVLLDPNTMSADGSIALHGWFPSHDGRYVAYALSRNNADSATMRIRDVASGRDLEEEIEDARYAQASWRPDGSGFYYTWIPADATIPAPEMPGHAEVRFHALGKEPEDDPVVMPALGDPTTFLGADLSRDGRWLLLHVSHGWSRTDVYLQDVAAASGPRGGSGEGTPFERAGFRPLVEGKDATYSVTPWRDALYVSTNEGAPRSRVFKASVAEPWRARWREIVPERPDATLQSLKVVGEQLLLVYLKDAANVLEVRTLEGELVRDVELPGIGSIGKISGNPDEDDAYYAFSSFTTMPVIHRTSVKRGGSTLWASSTYPADLASMTTEQVWYPSKDGTKVSMFLIHRKDMRRDGDTPTILTGYGGFNVSQTPWFSSAFVAWIERGGLVALPNLRGGGEYGEPWHRAGMLAKKQNVFDDFIAAAEYLERERYTSRRRLAIYGRSNGGLLVGAAMVQRPELFRAVVCGVPLLDMVRYHRFGAGTTWIEEYGSADDAALFPALHAYSPYHHVVRGVAYPALLLPSVDSDDRVDPMHARKFAAAMQWATDGRVPVLLRIERNAGHGGADLVRQYVDSWADAFAFLLAELGAG